GQAGVGDSLVLNGATVPLKEQGSCLSAPSGMQAETLPARRLSCQSGACSSYLPLELLQHALCGATFEECSSNNNNNYNNLFASLACSFITHCYVCLSGYEEVGGGMSIKSHGFPSSDVWKREDSLEKTLMLGKIERLRAQEEGDDRGRDVEDRSAWRALVHGVMKSRTRLNNNNKLNMLIVLPKSTETGPLCSLPEQASLRNKLNGEDLTIHTSAVQLYESKAVDADRGAKLDKPTCGSPELEMEIRSKCRGKTKEVQMNSTGSQLLKKAKGALRIACSILAAHMYGFAQLSQLWWEKALDQDQNSEFVGKRVQRESTSNSLSWDQGLLSLTRSAQIVKGSRNTLHIKAPNSILGLGPFLLNPIQTAGRMLSYLTTKQSSASWKQKSSTLGRKHPGLPSVYLEEENSYSPIKKCGGMQHESESCVLLNATNPEDSHGKQPIRILPAYCSRIQAQYITVFLIAECK
ncbi:Hypothetical predicted protein, partial [Podarcis lilfordi]